MTTKTTGLKSISEGQSEVHLVDPRKLSIRKGWNSRNFDDPENAAYIEELVYSIIEVGVKQPLTVTHDKGTTWIDDGECRWRAACLAIERTGATIRIPVRAEEWYASDQDRLINQRLRNGGKPFTIFEDAAHMKRLLDLGMKQDEIAKKCAISAARVSQILDYNTVGKVGRDLVQSGQASASLVMEVTKSEGTDAEKALLAGMKVAKKNGHAKLKPNDVQGARINVSKALRDAMEYSDVDDSDERMCVIKMPMEHWDRLKQAAKL